jgi:autotransporter-associated beta strand protein
LNGNLYFNKMDYSKNVLEVGALGEDMALGGSFCYSEGQDSKGNWRVRGNGNDIRKVGVGNLTLTATRVRNVFLADGVVTLAHGTNSVHQETRYTFEGGTMAITGKYDSEGVVDFSDPSALIVDSTSPVCFSNGVNEVHTWATALAASNVGGLTKKGAGTLTLTAAPLYTGLTTIEEGTLVVPDGTALTVNAFSAGTLSGAASVTYAYPASTVLAAPATSGSVSYAAPLDISNIASIDASAATLVVGQPYVVVAATSVTGYTKESLAALPFTLPAGAKAEKWSLKVLAVEGRRCLCIAPKLSGTRIIFR